MTVTNEPTPTVPAPTRLSDAIEMALTDLEKCEKDPRYVIDMGNWHFPRRGVCHVCFAGSVMAQTHRVSPGEVVISDEFEDDWRTVFDALDSVRCWCIEDALDRFTSEDARPVELDFLEAHPIHPSYHLEPDLFKQRQRELAAFLRERGL